jgi:hypothetical protein
MKPALGLVLGFLGILGCPGAGGLVNILLWLPGLYGLRLEVSF